MGGRYLVFRGDGELAHPLGDEFEGRLFVVVEGGEELLFLLLFLLLLFDARVAQDGLGGGEIGRQDDIVVDRVVRVLCWVGGWG